MQEHVWVIVSWVAIADGLCKVANDPMFGGAVMFKSCADIVLFITGH
jgi:hypothetical protein